MLNTNLNFSRSSRFDCQVLSKNANIWFMHKTRRRKVSPKMLHGVIDLVIRKLVTVLLPLSLQSNYRDIRDLVIVHTLNITTAVTENSFLSTDSKRMV